MLEQKSEAYALQFQWSTRPLSSFTLADVYATTTLAELEERLAEKTDRRVQDVSFGFHPNSIMTITYKRSTTLGDLGIGADYRLWMNGQPRLAEHHIATCAGNDAAKHTRLSSSEVKQSIGRAINPTGDMVIEQWDVAPTRKLPTFSGKDRWTGQHSITTPVEVKEAHQILMAEPKGKNQPNVVPSAQETSTASGHVNPGHVNRRTVSDCILETLKASPQGSKIKCYASRQDGVRGCSRDAPESSYIIHDEASTIPATITQPSELVPEFKDESKSIGDADLDAKQALKQQYERILMDSRKHVEFTGKYQYTNHDDRLGEDEARLFQSMVSMGLLQYPHSGKISLTSDGSIARCDVDLSGSPFDEVD